MAYPFIPNLNTKFFCIVDRKKKDLAAIISSYINEVDKYSSFFEFPTVYVASSEIDKDKLEVNVITRTRAKEFAVRINNALSALGGCEYVILAGLDENQKSYLHLPDDINIIEIEDIGQVDFLLDHFVQKDGYLDVKKDDILPGLYYSLLNNQKIRLNDYANSIKFELEQKEGIIIIENISAASTVIALNYAYAFNLAVALIEKPNTKSDEISALIDDWKNGGSKNSFHDLCHLVYSKIENINFPDYKFATFFTSSVPYSLILENVIPFTYVNNILSPDFFIFNALLIENRRPLFSSIVFSPIEFGVDEETNYVINKLVANNYFVKELTGNEASVYNLENHVKEYPYELLHICSHGGETGGYSLKEEFTDRDGTVHVVEYDEVVSFAPKKGSELVNVTTTNFWRKFDGLVWGSKEFKNAKYPHHVFTDMVNELKNVKGKSRRRKDVVCGSSAIKCIDFIYQPAFNIIAGLHSHPFIFNNTCYSWSNISESFLSVGARGYIGTLWAVENEVAKNTAEAFYDNLFDNTILSALEKAIAHTRGTSSENIYMYWGLHFQSFKRGASVAENRMKVASRLLTSFYRWRDHLTKVEDPNTQESINELINWNFKQLFDHFREEVAKLIPTR
ncbi:CHAT domain-containing protein [Pontibacter harenae]|uniref:CHAT domain-containing protein n=1 Tax=Pontibacter harenae TaxID=2894083 RepID=UPI001E590C99|nr:CHAT domain-containing protein [Pontibacter harenae]MCC9168656.1 CHAT domain-containing protein [Pontibacter harenae]